MKAVLVRHTRLVADVAGHCYGRADVALADTFAEEARALAEALPWMPGEIWTSPARRCRRLADVLAAGAPVTEVARLQELDFGAWEGRRWEEFRGPESEAWALDPWTLHPPGGETGNELWARVAAVRAEVMARGAEARVLVVTHAGVIRVWRRLAAGGAPGPEVFADDVGYGSVWSAG
jgi:alpha-ribazole phosphatase